MTTNYTPSGGFPWVKKGEPIQGSEKTPAEQDGVANRAAVTLLENDEWLRIRTSAVSQLLEVEGFDTTFSADVSKAYELTVQSDITVSFPGSPKVGDVFRLKMIAGDRTKFVTFVGAGKLIVTHQSIVHPANFFNYLFAYDGLQWLLANGVDPKLTPYGMGSLDDAIQGLQSQSLILLKSFVQTNRLLPQGYIYPVDTRGGALTLQLPADPVEGDRIALYDAASNFGTSSCTIDRNGKTIIGLASNYLMSNDDEAVDLVFLADNWQPVSNAQYGNGGLIIGAKTNVAFTAVKGTLHPVQSNGAGLTVTFPASPIVGDTIGLLDYDRQWNTSPVTINRNGKMINGQASNVKHSASGTSVTYRYIDEILGWSVQSLTVIGLDATVLASVKTVSVSTVGTPGTMYWVDTTATNPVTITLPPSPAVGTVVGIGDIGSNAHNKPITVARNNQPIMSVADDLQLTSTNAVVKLRYMGVTLGWRIEDALFTASQAVQRFNYSATQGQKDFVCSYVVGNVQVFRLGRLLMPNDYVATSGTGITLNDACNVADDVVVIAPIVLTIADVYTKSESDQKYLVSPVFTGIPRAITQPKMTRDTRLATTEFVLNQGLHSDRPLLISPGDAITKEMVGRILYYNQSGTQPMPVGLPDGTIIMFQIGNGDNRVTLTVESPKYFAFGTVQRTSILLSPGDHPVFLMHFDGNWTVVSGGLRESPNWELNSAVSGFQILPTGMILQWGVTPALSNNADTNIAFPMSFRTRCNTFVISHQYVVNSGIIGYCSGAALTRSQAVCRSSGVGLPASWVAVGI